MEAFEFISLPSIQFSHIYSADRYSSTFNPKEDCIEITYLKEGELFCTFEGVTHHVKKDDVFCNLYRSQSLITAGTFHKHYTVFFNVKYQTVSSRSPGLFLPSVTPASMNTAKIRNIIDDFILNQLYYRESPSRCAEKFFALVCEIDDCNRKNKNIPIPSELLYIKHAKEYIHQNIQQRITQGEVADYLSISPEYLCSIFKKNENTTVMKYINYMKLQNIQSIMYKENIHLKEACLQYGYADPNYVSRLFKRYFGYNITDKPKVLANKPKVFYEE